MSHKDHEVVSLTREIDSLLYELESNFWDVFVAPSYEPEDESRYATTVRDDKETWLYYGTRRLYYKICLFLEMKNVPLYLQQFVGKFGRMIDDKEKVMKDRGPLFDESEPSMIIHDDFRDFLSGFSEFNNILRRKGPNKLQLILENTHAIIAKTNTPVTKEPPIYNAVRWYLEIIYPFTRPRNNARFIKKFNTYRPDILVPEASSAIEYKLIKKGKSIGNYLDQVKTDADNYTGDPEYKYFYAVVFFEDKTDLNPAAFKVAVAEKSFPDNWVVLGM